VAEVTIMAGQGCRAVESRWPLLRVRWELLEALSRGQIQVQLLEDQVPPRVPSKSPLCVFSMVTAGGELREKSVTETTYGLSTTGQFISRKWISGCRAGGTGKMAEDTWIAVRTPFLMAPGAGCSALQEQETLRR
jgi:hypothetical protein